MARRLTWALLAVVVLTFLGCSDKPAEPTQPYSKNRLPREGPKTK
jgi:hypothetical protein